MHLHGNEWNDIICNIVKFMGSNEVRAHNMMTRLYNMNVMSWNADASAVVFCNNLSDTSLASNITLYLISNFKIKHVFFRVFEKPYEF